MADEKNNVFTSEGFQRLQDELSYLKTTKTAEITERLAEARAKLKIYKFMKTFCNKMLKYYKFKLYGTKANNEIIVKTSPEGLSNNDSLLKAYMKYDKLVDVENTHIKQLLYDY